MRTKQGSNIINTSVHVYVGLVNKMNDDTHTHEQYSQIVPVHVHVHLNGIVA